MARYKDAVCRQCRRIGEKLFLKGERCYSPRCAVEKRRRPPGNSNPRRRRPSDWAIQLKEKQKARFTYGVLERQFRRYFDMARESSGATGDNLIQVLESRLDNVVYRLSFSESRKQGRQLVNHGHFKVNGRRMDIPSYLVKPGDVIEWKRAGNNGSTPEYIQILTDGLPKRPVPSWLRLDVPNLSGEIVTVPHVSEVNTNIEARLIVEFYSK
ncbi:MAG: 30S ribosomal protein S4 [SAR202 cluster bacterium]|jgi:small subunit ribosomal protein S4|nr:30S ribosomal protein S4 [SAR202 cluster bacterium]MDP6512500.1 30S ribosomal protein S4 [SAR202 cluster bacterium]MDP6713156.1 30S ribosomal protein S4 [SAR202 cluster bacterium]